MRVVMKVLLTFAVCVLVATTTVEGQTCNFNGIKDLDETGVDCGVNCTVPCEEREFCASDNDCDVGNNAGCAGKQCFEKNVAQDSILVFQIYFGGECITILFELHCNLQRRRGNTTNTQTTNPFLRTQPPRYCWGSTCSRTSAPRRRRTTARTSGATRRPRTRCGARSAPRWRTRSRRRCASATSTTP